MNAKRKWPGWYKATPEERLERRKFHVVVAFGLLLGGMGAYLFLEPGRWTWFGFAMVPYGVTALFQVATRRESFWLDRLGVLACGLVALQGWRLTGHDILATAAIVSPTAVLADVFFHRRELA